MAKAQSQSPAPLDEVAAAAMPSSGGQDAQVRVSTNTNRRGLKRNENLPGCWMQGGTIHCFKSVERVLADLARTRGVVIDELSGQVDRIQAARVGTETRIYLYPMAKDHPDGVEVTRTRKTKDLSINLFDYLAAENLLIPVGRKQRFDLTYVPESDAPAGIGESLRLDLSKPLEEKLLPKRKSRAKKKPASPPAGPQTGTKEPEPKAQGPVVDSQTA